MNRWLLVIGLIAEVALVTGQLLLKRAMQAHPRSPLSKRGQVQLVVLSIAAHTLYFFLWMGLLQSNDLSRVYPFDAVSAVLIVLAAVLLLGERLTLRAWVAISFIVAGLVFISFW